MKMEPLGRIWRIVQTGHIIVEPVNPGGVAKLRLGLRVFDSSRSQVGTLSDVVGNVNSPYVVVKPIDRSSLKRLNVREALYVEVPRPSGKRRRRKGRRPAARGKPSARRGSPGKR